MYRLREPMVGVFRIDDGKMRIGTLPSAAILVVQGHLMKSGMVDATWKEYTTTVTVFAEDLKARGDLIKWLS